jgi:EAL domain-containing protein (putative c-di-GMP-specific phosphodiesterase class I)
MAGGVIYAAARDITDEVQVEEEELSRSREATARVHKVLDSPDFPVAFQPIVDFRTREVVGFEALARFDQRPLRAPDEWFAEADTVGLRVALELRAVREASAFAGKLPDGAFMSVNASPDTLIDPEFRQAVRDLDGDRLVIEVTEHSAVSDYDVLQDAITDLRWCGVRLAIDDAGAGFSSLKHIVRLVPEFIKLDLFLTRGIETDPVKRALAGAMVAFATEVGARLVAEGVETNAELQALGDLGFQQAQGYLLGRPRLAVNWHDQVGAATTL